MDSENIGARILVREIGPTWVPTLADVESAKRIAAERAAVRVKVTARERRVNASVAARIKRTDAETLRTVASTLRLTGAPNAARETDKLAMSLEAESRYQARRASPQADRLNRAAAARLARRGPDATRAVETVAARVAATRATLDNAERAELSARNAAERRAARRAVERALADYRAACAGRPCPGGR